MNKQESFQPTPSEKEKFIEEYRNLQRRFKERVPSAQRSSMFHRIAELQTILGDDDITKIETELKNND